MDILARIKAARDERVRDLHLDLPIPTWDGDLVARFEVMPRSTVEKFGNRKRNLDVDLDFIIEATSSLWARDPERAQGGTRMEENEEYVRVEDENGSPVKFEERLGLMLGMSEDDAARARNVILYCFKNNGIAISGFVVKLLTWMNNTDAEVAESLVGE